ncbi:MAG TPA: cell surface protein SprA [Ignavibacteria bacterium]
MRNKNRVVIKTSLFSLVIFFLTGNILLGLLLATFNVRALSDTVFYASSYCKSLSFLESSKSNNINKSKSDFPIIPPLIKLNPFLFFDKLNEHEDSFNLISPDTTKPDSVKSLISDTLLSPDTIKKVLGDSLDLTKTDTTHAKDSIVNIVDPLTQAIFDSLMKIDTTKLPDTLAVQGSNPLVLYDSTARVQHLKYYPKDNITPPYFEFKLHPLFRTNRTNVLYEVKIDTATNMVKITETINGKNIRIPIWMTLDEYIQATKEYYTKKSWEDIAKKYDFKYDTTKKEIGALLSDITNIDIPIPDNPIMSIFGDRSRINLRITGNVEILGAFRTSSTNAATISRTGNTRSEPDFKQNVSIMVDGTIGDKLTISANWDTQRLFDYENQLKISYKGYEDELIQSIEAGNVALSTASGLVGSSQALFGVKAQMNVGPLKLTTVASQKKSEKKSISVKGGTQKTPFELRAFQYSTNHFFLDTLYRRTFRPYYGNPVPQINENLRVVDIEVWVTRPGSIESPDEREVIADINLPELPPNGKYDNSYQTKEQIPGTVEVGRFIRLKSDQFILHPETGFITLTTSLSQNQVIAVAYKTQNGKVYGTFSNAIDTLQKRVVLKLVKPSNLIPQFKQAWNMQLKNIYYIGGRNLTKETLENVKIYYTVPGSENQDNLEGTSLLTILGLDQTDDAQTGSPDGKFDFIEGRTIDATRGEIIFPFLEPFREAFLEFTPKLQKANDYVFADVYDTTVLAAQQNTDKNRFIIKGEYSSSSSSVYRLGMSVVPGSVQVLLNGIPLEPGVGYTVDEVSGTVIIRDESALVTGANVEVKYEENDLMSFASKTLLGASAEMDLGKTTKLGFGWINLIQQTLSDKVRLGEEPINNHIFGISGTTQHELPFISKALNYLPFYISNEMSTISLKADAAYMLPDANTKKSLIASDHGEGIAYIDDFEGARQALPLMGSYAIWKSSSAPVELDGIGQVPDSIAFRYKAKTTWGGTERDININDVWPNKQAAKEDRQIGSIVIEYDPNKRGEYNYEPNLSNPKINWGGMMRGLGSNATNLAAQNYTALEIWMNVNGSDLQDAKLYIDLGKISERMISHWKVPGRNGLHTEDGVNPAFPIINGILNEGEDVGIDGLTNEQERALFPQLGDDPSGDDWAYPGSGSTDFSKINGTEGNAYLESSKIPDTEDLNRNGVCDLTNSYFTYEIPLDTAKAIKKKLIVGGGSKGWYQYRIPLNEPTKSIGSPSLDVVEMIRLRFSGTTKNVIIRVVQFDVVGNQWQELITKDSTGATVQDTTFKISVVSVDETPYYSMPPGLDRATDRTRPDQDIKANEQSLALILKGLRDGQSREAVRYFTSRPLDVFNYKTMKMFVHGDPSFGYVDSSNYDVEFFFKFGADTANYYEYRMPLRPGWEPNNIEIDFAKLTSVKQFQDTIGGRYGFGSIDVPGKPGAKYQIMGKPSLTNIVFFSVGVKNPKGKGTELPIYGEVWVDELRLSNVNNTPGWAYRLDGSLKIGALATINFNYSKTDPNFHSVDQKFGSRSDDKNWGVNANLVLQNLLPQKLSGSTLNVSYTHTETVTNPQYIPGTDVKVNEAAEELSKVDKRSGDSLRVVSQTVRVSETFAMPTINIKINSNEWYIRETINKLTFGFNFNNQTERSPILQWRKNWSWDFKADYNVNLNEISEFLSVSPFYYIFKGVFLFDQYKDFKISIFPKSFAAGLSANRTRTEEKYRLESLLRKPIRNFTAARNLKMNFIFTEGGLLNVSSDYALSVSSSLAHLETDTSGLIQRSNKEIFSKIFFDKGIINFGLDNSYSQDISFRTSPKIPDIFDLPVFFELTGDYRVGYKWQNNFTMKELGKSAGFSSNINTGLNFKLKSLGDRIFGEGTESSQSSGRGSGGTRREGEASVSTDTTTGGKKINVIEILKSIVKIPLFDYDNIQITFSQSNNASSSGIPGSTGFGNFWQRVPFFQSSDPENGPSLLYQLGLISDPTGKLTNFGLRSKFPFFGFDYEPGIRVPNPSGNLSDNFSQQNQITIGTNRTLFKDISIQLNWKVGWNYNRNTTIKTDELGNILTDKSVKTLTSDIDRSFIVMPDFFLFKFLGSGGIDKVGELYAAAKADVNDKRDNVEKFSKAFEEGFEFLPFTSKIFGAVAPRANWSIRWSGLEKIPFLAKFANSISLTHSYSSNFTTRFRVTEVGKTITESQRIVYAFNPLIGIDISFRQIFGGNFNGNMRYTTGGSYDLNTSSENIIESTSKEISISANYSKSGLEIPFFGVYLRNDLEFSISVGYGKQARTVYKIEGGTMKGIPDDNSSRMSFEPRFGYTISTKVRGSVYYKYYKNEGARIPGSSTNEGGLNVNISIN